MRKNKVVLFYLLLLISHGAHVFEEIQGRFRLIEKFPGTGYFLATNVFLLIIPVAVLGIQLILGEFPKDRLFLALGAVVLVSIVALSIGLVVAMKVLNLTNTIKALRQSLVELSKARATLVSNQALKQFESDADRIRIISPDLYDDHNNFYDTVKDNVSKRKVYQYVIPNRKVPIDKVERLRRRLQKELKITDKTRLPDYRIESNFPILTEYVLHEKPVGTEELSAFVEIRIGPSDDDTTNMPLTGDEAHELNRYFDELFE